MHIKPLVLFDLDYTLLEGDSEELWARHLLAEHVVDDGFFERIEAFYQDYRRGTLEFDRYEQFLLGPLAVQPLERLLDLRKDYLETIRRAVRPTLMDRIAGHRSDGCELVLVTACNSFLAEPIASMLGFANLICTQVETQAGHFTGRTCQVPAFRYGKVIRLAEWMREHRLGLAGSWCYSDSYNDLPLLELVDYPVMVTPDPELRQHGLAAGWELLDLPLPQAALEGRPEKENTDDADRTDSRGFV